MTAILGGVGAALAFATATLCSSRSSRLIGPGPALEWAIAAVLATVAGEALSAGVVLTLTVITVGVVLSATARDAPDEAAPARDPRATALLAIRRCGAVRRATRPRADRRRRRDRLRRRGAERDPGLNGRRAARDDEAG